MDNDNFTPAIIDSEQAETESESQEASPQKAEEECQDRRTFVRKIGVGIIAGLAAIVAGKNPIKEAKAQYGYCGECNYYYFYGCERDGSGWPTGYMKECRTKGWWNTDIWGNWFCSQCANRICNKWWAPGRCPSPDRVASEGTTE